MIPRKELMSKLATVDPALAPEKGPIPANAHYWFTGRNLMTYNGRLAIMVPLKTEFRGMVPRKLASLLKTNTSEEIELIPEGEGTLVVKQGKSKVKLATMSPDFKFHMPRSQTFDADKPIDVDSARFVQNLENGLRGCSGMTHTTDLLGVTITLTDKDWMDFWATDAEVIAFGTCRFEGELITKLKRFIIPTEMCKQLVKHAAGHDRLFMDITDDYVMLDTPAVTIFSGIIEPDTHALPFRSQLNAVFTVEAENDLAPIPEELIPILERANVVTAKAVKATVMLEKVDTDLTVVAKSVGGSVIESCTFGHKGRVVKTPIQVKRVLDAAKHYQKMSITEQAIIFFRDKCGLMISPPATDI